MRRLLAALVGPLLVGCSGNVGSPAQPSPAEISRLESQLAESPADTRAAVHLAQAYRSAGRFADARPLLERAVEQRQTDAHILLLLGLTYEDLRLFAEARRVYSTYTDRNASGSLRNTLVRRLALLQRRELEASVDSAIARERRQATTPPQPYTIAVFPYQFVGNDENLKPLGRALAELLVTDLSQTARIQVLERAQVQLLLDELQLAQTGRVDPATAAQTGRMLRAERIVHGSMAGTESALQLETTIVRVTTTSWPGEAVPAANRPNLVQLSEADRLQQLIAMQKRLALRIYASLGVQLTAAEQERITRQPTSNILALVAYGRGLEAEDAGDFRAAARHFAESAALDGRFTAARTSASRATSIADAVTVGTGELESQAGADATAQAAAAVSEFFLANPATRDAAAEILRTEGVATATILELIIRRQ